MERRWLKKYIQLEYLQEILENQQLHLGDPKDWDDKNDSKLIELYANACGSGDIRVACLTTSRDRFHFWDSFGKRELGFCLWFDALALQRDIAKDGGLVGKPVQYLSLRGLAKLEADSIPFAKREQYRAESEFRVLRKNASGNHKFKFSMPSLKRIYFSPWLSPSEVEGQKKSIFGDPIQEKYPTISVFHNRMLNYERWIEAAKKVLDTQI